MGNIGVDAHCDVVSRVIDFTSAQHKPTATGRAPGLATAQATYSPGTRAVRRTVVPADRLSKLIDKAIEKEDKRDTEGSYW